MENAVRYEIIEEIAQGDFATVFRGRDLKLGREVAVKQLHQQYLNSSKLTERYWQEAQMMAKLEHPHVMTIYDVVPERGWLILELMKGSLKDLLHGRAIKLSDLRLTILFAARALSFFQQHNILHGDVKPSNLLVDRNNWIKLGDFGIARRMKGDDGSAIKGTTRYMAPEVVSDKFGPVGPHSDIYSLGFSAYELLCGERFDTLFPGLNMFGRDQQLAWMMWHSASDRRLPKIQDVLEGVPEDLAVIIERMTSKDPRWRYRSADQVIADLENEGGPSTSDLAHCDDEDAAEALRLARRKRRLTIGAMAVSLLLSVTMFFFPQPKEVTNPAPVLPTEGIVGKVVPEESTIFLKSEERILVRENDLILLNNAVCPIDQLRPADQLEITYMEGPDGKTKRIMATRGALSVYAGRVASVNSADRILSVAIDGASVDQVGEGPAGKEAEQTREFAFDGETAVTLNEKPATIADLKAGDSLTVRFRTDDDRLYADSLAAKREFTVSGVLESFDPRTNQVSLRVGEDLMTLVLADPCSIQLNGRRNLAGRRVTLTDLTSGDRIISLSYDSRVLSMALERDLSDVVEVWSVDAAAGRLSVLVDGETVEVTASDATVVYQGKTVDLSFLRKGDRIVVDHDSPDKQNMLAKAIEVTDLVRDPRTVALVISQQTYDNIQITPYEFAQHDANLVREALDVRARVPDSQLAVLSDLTRDNLLRSIDEFFGLQQTRNQLLVYFVGQAYVDLNSGVTYLAPRDFTLNNMKDTGVPLRDLISRMEAFQAREKLLLLDTCHKVSANEAQSQPSTEEQIQRVKVGEAVSRSVTVIGSCSKGQMAALDMGQKSGRFGLELAQAVGGKADADFDGQVSADELFPYIMGQLARVGQTPSRFLPDTRPRRLSPEAGTAISRMLVDLDRVRPSAGFDAAYADSKRLAGDEPDAELAFALVKLKSGRTGESLDVFNAVLATHPEALVAYHGAAYQKLVKKEWDGAADTLARLVSRIAVQSRNNGAYTNHLLRFAGTARSFIANISESPTAADVIDAAAAKLAVEDRKEFDAGMRSFETQAAESTASRPSLRNFYRFDFSQVKDHLLDQLDK